MIARRRIRAIRTRHWPTLLLCTVVLALLIVADRQGWLLVERHDELELYHGRAFAVVRVIDGDTIEIDAFDPAEQRPTTRVRLWGINCPEAASPGRPAGQPWSAEATAFTTERTKLGPVVLRLEPHRLRGRYGRILAHIDTADGRCLNEALLAAGLAVADDRWPHGELSRYARAERRARDAGVGIWSSN